MIVRVLLTGACLLLPIVAAAAQLRAELMMSGLDRPIAFVQDPSQHHVHVVVQQNGLVFILVDGAFAGTFLDLRAVTAGGGESGLLGFAFAPDYATSRRFFVNFTNLSGHTVIARFERRVNNPFEADPDSRFDLVWPGGLPFITQPFSNHNGGNLVFGPDGYLYVGMGDGGGGNDPFHNAQNPLTLLGKMLRIDVSVPDNDSEGYDVPDDNPFLGNPGVLPEIWAFGLRNPWRYSFDDFSRGGTGALIIGDVGQRDWEEVNYEPAGAGGRNYGWRNREGFHPNVTEPDPFPVPLTDPILEYSHNDGVSVTGGVVYRGTSLGPGFLGRYFFGDFGTSRIWSAALSIDPSTGEAAVANIIEHTAELAFASLFPASFGIDADGEIYVVSYAGNVFRITTGLVTNGTFASNVFGWQTFATPSPNFLVGGLNGGVFEFYREPPPPGTSNQAVLFQQTGISLAAGARLVARFEAGNTSSVRKRLSVLLTDHDFSDFFVCTFWLAPGAPLRPYEIHTRTTEFWENATIAFYAASVGSQGGFYRIDNVAIESPPGAAPPWTVCVDPDRPAPSGGVDGPGLILNGAFSGGLAPWIVFGQIAAQAANGVVEFHRVPGTPAGAVLQQTGHSMPANEILTATFRLGNASGIRQRVTVLLHDVDFSDLTVCTFWLLPGTPLQPYAISTYVTDPWSNATVSVYPASSPGAPWLLLDDVTLHSTPNVATFGTECVESGGPGGRAHLRTAAAIRRTRSTDPTLPARAAPPRDRRLRPAVPAPDAPPAYPASPALQRPFWPPSP